MMGNFIRADGWPLCPVCEEDELYSLLNWNGQGAKPPMAEYIRAGMCCYLCRTEFVCVELAADENRIELCLLPTQIPNWITGAQESCAGGE